MDEIIIDCTGAGMHFIYGDEMLPLMQEGEARVTRASTVEPGLPSLGQEPTKWYADLAPSGGPILSGCDTRKQALEAEVEWLKANKFGR